VRVLFVCGGITKKQGIPPLIKAQSESLKIINIDINYFLISKSGLFGYLWHIPKLMIYLRKNPVDIIHAHYSFAGVIASLANLKTPVIVSLLGSDIFGKSIVKSIIMYFKYLLNWNKVIVKSLAMKQLIHDNFSIVIPNGVNTSIFKPLNPTDCKNDLSWVLSKKHILFAANPNRKEKNFQLAKDSLRLLLNQNVQLHKLENIPHKDLPKWFNATDIVILTSLWEGSPNVIKEAMACNCPIVATNVGDIKWLFGMEQGHFIADFTAESFSSQIKQAFNFSEKYGRTKGRKRIIELGLDSSIIAKKINNVYETALK
jgi:teichuronic acid biosynthesis glycosyltransferase TuaC